MKIIDVHTHIYPDKIAERATEAIGKFYDLHMEGIGSVSKLLESMEQNDVSHSVVYSVATSAAQVQKINDFIVSEVNAHPDKFSGFGTMHLEYEDKFAEVDRCIAMGLKGIKLHPDTQAFNADDDRMLELYDYLQTKGLPLMLHCGDFRYDYSHPRRIARICRLFPKLTLIGAHFGGWSVWDEVLDYLRDTDCMVDTSSSSSFITAERFSELIHAYGADRVMFGTDFPMWEQKPELEKIMNVPMTETEREKIMYKNAESLLKI
ncbi:MAG: amidohydrolase family protein [Ruminococcus sp.]|nr:amidohydrolase family protein [Ruminococcus sp.]